MVNQPRCNTHNHSLVLINSTKANYFAATAKCFFSTRFCPPILLLGLSKNPLCGRFLASSTCLLEVLMRNSVLTLGVNLIALIVLIGISSKTIAAQSLSEAKKAVASYQTLREACADATGEKRLECMSRLSSASDSYREAKTFVLASKNKNRNSARTGQSGIAQYRVAKAH
jgi:hypothetical protein